MLLQKQGQFGFNLFFERWSYVTSSLNKWEYSKYFEESPPGDGVVMYDMLYSVYVGSVPVNFSIRHKFASAWCGPCKARPL